jgi:hypothetical protein
MVMAVMLRARSGNGKGRVGLTVAGAVAEVVAGLGGVVGAQAVALEHHLLLVIGLVLLVVMVMTWESKGLGKMLLGVLGQVMWMSPPRGVAGGTEVGVGLKGWKERRLVKGLRKGWQLQQQEVHL